MIIIGNQQVSLEDYNKIIFNNEKIEISVEALERVEKCFNFLDEFHENKII